MQYLIDDDLANAILAYLARQPYADTFQLIHRLQAVRPATPPSASQIAEAAPTENAPADADRREIADRIDALDAD